ncbi:protein kinase domain-containing protein [Kitasatospora nipponensis]
METEGPETRLIDGRFELLDRLGGGGMGLVWRARDTALQREVALKEVRPPDPVMAAADPAAAWEMRERVLREARALARLQHPNVAIIHHIVDTAEHPHPWLVMELVHGGSLADLLARGPLSVPQAARIGRGVLGALRAVHAAGILHRDVKPENVLLRGDGTPVLTDFGIAAMHGSTSLTATGSLIGSPEYIAPERIRGREGDPSSDLWSLGMMLYVAVEGHHPLRRTSAIATLAAVLDEPLPPPVHAGRLLPVLAALLAKDPAARPDAAQLDQLLAAAETGATGAGSGAGAGYGAAAPWGADAPEAGYGAGWGAATGSGPLPGPPGGATTPLGSPFPPPAYGGSGEYPKQHQQPQPPQYGYPAYGYPNGGYQSGGYPAGGHPSGGYPGGPDPATPWTPGGGAPAGYPGQVGFPAQPGYPGQVGHPQPGGDTGPTGQGATAVRPPATRRGRAPLAVLSVAGVAAAGVLAWTLVPGGGTATHRSGGTAATGGTPGAIPPATPGTTGSGTASPSATGGAGGAGGAGVASAGPSAAQQDLLTPAGVRSVIAALRPQMSGTKVRELDVYPDFANAEAPTPSDAKLYDQLNYRGGAVTREPGGTIDSDTEMSDLQLYNWDVIPDILAKALATLNVPNPKTRYLIIGPDIITGAPSIRVYLADDYRDGYLETDPKGNVTRTYPSK